MGSGHGKRALRTARRVKDGLLICHLPVPGPLLDHPHVIRLAVMPEVQSLPAYRRGVGMLEFHISGYMAAVALCPEVVRIVCCMPCTESGSLQPHEKCPQ